MTFNFLKGKLTLLICLLHLCVFANSTITINTEDERVPDISSSISVFLDSTKNLDFEQVLQNANFKVNQQEIINQGFNEAPLWLHFSLHNESNSLRSFILEIGNSSLDVVEVFEMKNDELLNYQLIGDKIPFFERKIPFRTHLYPLSLDESETKEFYLKIQTDGALQVPLTISTPTSFFIQHLKTETAYGIYIGIMLVMIIYNILIFISLRDLNYLYYAFPIISNTTFYLSLSGHHFQYLFPNYPSIANNITVISIGAWILTSSFYAKSSLQSEKYSKSANYALIGTMVLGGIGIILPFLSSYGFAVRVNSKMTLVNSLVMFVAGLMIWRNGNKSARFFILAWTAYLVGTFIFALMKFNFIEKNAFTTNVLAYGGIIEVIFLSLALSDKYKIYKKDKEKAQKALLEQQLKENIVLEEKVKERTIELEEKRAEIANAFDEINSKNIELEMQNEEIAAQRDMVESQKVKLEDNNLKITSSINYAERIQMAMLPTLEKVRDLFADSFIIFKPKDIVSGDFFWCAEVEGKKIVAAVDCTGHGVPGALMSLVGNNLLNDIVKKTRITSPEIILQALHIQINNSLYNSDKQLRDGMDMSILVYDTKANTVEYSGARNPLVYCIDGQIHLIKGNRNSIGSIKPQVSFDKHTIKVDKPTSFYIYSDGFQDQFGGTRDRKYGSKQFREKLVDNAEMTMPLQEQILTKSLQDWLTKEDGTNYSQTDDILVIGLRLSPQNIY
ncbi:7TM diverse intracellular signaling domain-containing protein [Flammeovirga kamogawensis]|uniref:SpoIIE family protein phosphatase n=1 Tax=Flammeovirga kamogawensis TaxID=373891 RepID=A0ABX8H3U9_9BACT|nr:7TM diverse intracellular signaling domain-containing protein [Flammeovirga kamogawensis]MBB6463514.1 serine phosphatase RsbU (regulator of sigma subunit) [Flammeovirga kamogawensis]QWG10573.1 SpoIIE family protein phosphatase [Flammeovirga kamogawensis]TRX63679.1 SpoIIE family protein phosphatase [Flammeovirga kamogawensis]